MKDKEIEEDHYDKPARCIAENLRKVEDQRILNLVNGTGACLKCGETLDTEGYCDSYCEAELK